MLERSMESKVKELFDSRRPGGDFSCVYEAFDLNLSDGTKLSGCISEYHVIERIGAAFFETYLPEQDKQIVEVALRVLASSIQTNRQLLLPISMQENVIKIRKHSQDIPVRYNQLPISNRYTFFVEARLSVDVKNSLYNHWENFGMEIVIKDLNFVEANLALIHPYAFISHDYRDKDLIARPLAMKLREDVGTVWFDEFSLSVGDSLRESIESGLKTADRCILLLSKHYLQNESWAKREFDSIFTRELVERSKVILPVWIDVTPKDVYKFSPILADRLAVQWSKGLDEVVNQLAPVLRRLREEE